MALEKGNMEELEKHNIYFTSIIKNHDDDIYQYYLRMGNVTGNLFLENLGAKVPLRLILLEILTVASILKQRNTELTIL